VPFSQGLEFHHALKARGVPTKLLVYEQDVHAIDRPVSEADHWLQIAGWLEAHL
jgi:acylaminoacyl-peptidase